MRKRSLNHTEKQIQNHEKQPMSFFFLREFCFVLCELFFNPDALILPNRYIYLYCREYIGEP